MKKWYNLIFEKNQLKGTVGLFYVLLTRASLYNLVNETNLVHNLSLEYFVNSIYNLYMFQTSPGPSSGETTAFMRHLVPVILYSWLSGMHTKKSAKQNDEIHWEYIVHQVGFIYKITVGHLYPSFSGVTTQLISKAVLTHTVNTVCLVKDCNGMKW
jgi:hypothetical protein